MNTQIPREVDDFLFALGTFEDGDPQAFEEYAKTSANLLWAKYVMFADDSIPINPAPDLEQ